MSKLNRVLLLLVLVVVIICALLFCTQKMREPSGEPEQTTDSAALQTSEQTTEAATTQTTESAETTQATTEATTEATTQATTEPVVTEPPEAYIGQQAAQLAIKQLGKEFKYGTAGPNTFDASGLLQYCYGVYDIEVPRSTAGQAGHGVVIERENILPGDAVFFWTNNPGEPEFVGIYIGDDQFIAACNSSRPVCQMDMTNVYYVEHYVFARRFYGLETEEEQ